ESQARNHLLAPGAASRPLPGQGRGATLGARSRTVCPRGRGVPLLSEGQGLYIMRRTDRRLCSAAVAAVLGFLFGSASLAQNTSAKASYPSFGSIVRKDARFDRLVPRDATIEKLSEGYDWSEGPVWMKKGGYLLFSDVPQNKVYRFKEGEKVTVFLEPSGYTGKTTRGGEPGSNGLNVDAEGR